MKKELVLKANKYLANVSVEYFKLHNLHWNVVGVQFKAAHEYLESLYDSLADVLDEVAELIKMNGEAPLASMKDYLNVSEIVELDSKEIGIKDAISIALKDMKLLKENAQELRALANENDLYQLSVMMEDHLANYSKSIWFMESMLK